MKKFIAIAMLFISSCSTVDEDEFCNTNENVKMMLYMGCVEHSPTPKQCLKAAKELSYICMDK